MAKGNKPQSTRQPPKGSERRQDPQRTPGRQQEQQGDRSRQQGDMNREERFRSDY